MWNRIKMIRVNLLRLIQLEKLRSARRDTPLVILSVHKNNIPYSLDLTGTLDLRGTLDYSGTPHRNRKISVHS